jgi:hypothetical protein
MTQTTHEQDGARKVEAYLVLEDARIGTLPKHFGARMMTVEHMVYNFMREFVAEYKGAFWDFYAYFAQGRPSIHGKPVHGFAPCRSTAREAGRVGLSIKDDHSSMSGFFDHD